MRSRHPPIPPVVAVVFAAAAWGLFWLPLRAIEDNGLAAGWAALGVFATPLLLLLPIAALRSARGLPTGTRDVVTGLLAGGGVALYSESVLLTDVARALILFYVTPVWSTILEISLMGRRLTKARAFALILGLAGLFTILGGRTGVPLPQNLGDSIALLSGMVWAGGSMRLRTISTVGIFENVFSFFLYGAAVALFFVFLPFDSIGAAPT